MKNLTEYLGQTLTITQPKWFKNNFELRNGEEIIGEIQLKGFFGTRVLVNAFGLSLEFYKPSFWKNIIEIKEADKQMPFSSYTEKFFSRKGTLNLPQGESLIIALGYLKTADSIRDTSDNILVVMKQKFSFKEKVEISVESNNKLLDKYPWVIVLAWHLRQQRRRQAAAR